nr:hypothetical protein [Tanacetum cinerariifolium]
GLARDSTPLEQPEEAGGSA